jgi:hypothetical protein
MIAPVMRILLAVLLVLVCAPADAQVVSLWDPAYVAVRPGASVKVMIIASIRPGYLVAARQPQGRQLQPLSVSLRPAPYLAVGTPIYPAAKMTELDPDQAGLAGHTGTLRIAVPISVSRQAPAGELQLHGELHYQACSPRVCFKPRSLPIRIPIEVQAARTP